MFVLRTTPICQRVYTIGMPTVHYWAVVYIPLPQGLGDVL